MVLKHTCSHIRNTVIILHNNIIIILHNILLSDGEQTLLADE